MTGSFIAVLAFLTLCVQIAAAREVKGRPAQTLYQALRGAGAQPDDYAGGAALAVGLARCSFSKNATGDDRYRCDIEDVAAPAELPPTEDAGALVSRLQDGAGKVEALLAHGETEQARRALQAYEGDLRVFRIRNGGRGGDFDEILTGLQRYLVCEETSPPAASAATTAGKAREFVLYALKVKDARRLAQHVDCGAGLGVEASEFDRPHARLTLAERLMSWREGDIAVVGAGEPLVVSGFKGKALARMAFRQHPKSRRWYLWSVTFDRP